MSKWQLLRSALLDGKGGGSTSPSELSIHAHKGFDVCPNEVIADGKFVWTSIELVVHIDVAPSLHIVAEHAGFRDLILSYLHNRDAPICWIFESRACPSTTVPIVEVNLMDQMYAERCKTLKLTVEFKAPESSDIEFICICSVFDL